MSEGLCRIIPNYGRRCISPANPSMRTSGTYTGQYKGKLFQSTPAMYVHTYACMYVCVYVCMYECMYAWMYVFIYVCVYVCMYVCYKWFTWIANHPFSLFLSYYFLLFRFVLLCMCIVVTCSVVLLSLALFCVVYIWNHFNVLYLRNSFTFTRPSCRLFPHLTIY